MFSMMLNIVQRMMRVFNDKVLRIKRKGSPDDVMKLRMYKHLRVLRLCNPPAFQLTCLAVYVARHEQENVLSVSIV